MFSAYEYDNPVGWQKAYFVAESFHAVLISVVRIFEMIAAFSLPHCDLGDAWSPGYACPLLVLAVSEWSLSHDTEYAHCHAIEIIRWLYVYLLITRDFWNQLFDSIRNEKKNTIRTTLLLTVYLFISINTAINVCISHCTASSAAAAAAASWSQTSTSSG